MRKLYRFENGSVYEYCRMQRVYVFIGKLNGKTKNKFINDYEKQY